MHYLFQSYELHFIYSFGSNEYFQRVQRLAHIYPQNSKHVPCFFLLGVAQYDPVLVLSVIKYLESSLPFIMSFRESEGLCSPRILKIHLLTMLNKKMLSFWFAVILTCNIAWWLAPKNLIHTLDNTINYRIDIITLVYYSFYTRQNYWQWNIVNGKWGFATIKYYSIL